MTVKRPVRIRLSRTKGWKMPPDTVKVDRSTDWGNPFVVGKDGSAAECVALHRYMLAGYLCVVATPSMDDQRAHRRYVNDHLHLLVGKNLACWCALDRPCHADVLLALAARHRKRNGRGTVLEQFAPPSAPEKLISSDG